MAETRLFGIRHHGPGSARSVLSALDDYEPDFVLVEGPPDADSLLIEPLSNLTPPVAILVYDPSQPSSAVFYPFAEFSPEFQAIKWAQERQVPIQFMDLAQKVRFGTKEDESPTELETWRDDPILKLAEIDGFSDGERWWDHRVESMHHQELFDGIAEAMTALREGYEESEIHEVQREAAMRSILRQAQKQAEKVAVICGAWHVPALQSMPSMAHDRKILKGLPSVKTKATWIPWSFGRLSRQSGYGAGIEAPGWYDHLWRYQERSDQAILWLTKAAHLARAKKLDVAPSHVIETVRLAEALAAIAERPLVGLPELNDAILCVMAGGEPFCFDLFKEELLIQDRLGAVPEQVGDPPLMQDLKQSQKSCRLQISAVEKDLDLDLRKPIHLMRSHLLHRLDVLGVPWGQHLPGGRGKGTFHENWRIQWDPSFHIRLIEAGIWGNTIELAASHKLIDEAKQQQDLGYTAKAIQNSLRANLEQATTHLVLQLQNEAALSHDIQKLLESIPALADLARYGDVRSTDSSLVQKVVEGIVLRSSLQLPQNCVALDEDAAREFLKIIIDAHAGVQKLEIEALSKVWLRAQFQISQNEQVNRLIAGRAQRILYDEGEVDSEETARVLGLQMSVAQDPLDVALWLEGFLYESGMLLIHDQGLWDLVDAWICGLSHENFQALLPIMRRTFSSFAPSEVSLMGQKVQSVGGAKIVQPEIFDRDRAKLLEPFFAKVLGGKRD